MCACVCVCVCVCVYFCGCVFTVTRLSIAEHVSLLLQPSAIPQCHSHVKLSASPTMPLFSNTVSPSLSLSLSHSPHMHSLSYTHTHTHTHTHIATGPVNFPTLSWKCAR